MKYKLNFLMLVLISGIFSTLLHEFGHCIFYWIQKIPASMSLVMEYPLINITAKQYGIGSAGGPLVNIFLMLGAFYFAGKSEKKTKKWDIFSAVIIANSFYLIFRAILGIIKNDGGEIESVMNLFGLNFKVAAVLFIIIAITVLVFWIRMFSIRISLGNFSYYLFLFISYMVIIMVMEGIDTKYFWNNYPTIEIEDVGIHNPHNFNPPSPGNGEV